MLINAIRQMLERKAECVLPKETVMEEHIQEWRERANRTVFTPQNCTSYYQTGGKNDAPRTIWPGLSSEYYLRTRNISPDNFKFF